MQCWSICCSEVSTCLVCCSAALMRCHHACLDCVTSSLVLQRSSRGSGQGRYIETTLGAQSTHIHEGSVRLRRALMDPSSPNEAVKSNLTCGCRACESAQQCHTARGQDDCGEPVPMLLGVSMASPSHVESTARSSSSTEPTAEQTLLAAWFFLHARCWVGLARPSLAAPLPV